MHQVILVMFENLIDLIKSSTQEGCEAFYQSQRFVGRGTQLWHSGYYGSDFNCPLGSGRMDFITDFAMKVGSTIFPV